MEQRIEEAIRDAERIRSELSSYPLCILLKPVCVCVCVCVCAESEEASLATLKEKKQSLLRELQQQMETARAVS